MNARAAAIAFAAFLTAAAPANALSLVLDAPQDSAAGASTVHGIGFTTGVEDWIASVTITFPANFTFSSPAVQGYTGIGAGTVSVDGNSIVYSVTSPAAVPASTPVTISISGIVNAQAAGSYTVSVTTKNATPAVIEGPADSTAFTITAANIFAVSVAPATPSGTVGSTFSLTATAYDAYGNANTTGGFGWYSTNASVSDCTTCASNNATTTATFSAIAQGTANATAVSKRDESKQAAANLTVIADTTPPSITVTSPASGSFQQALVAFNFTSSEQLAWIQLNISNATGVFASFDNSSFTHAGTAFNVSTNLASLADGSYTYTVYANDSSNNTGTASASFTLDKTLPTINNYSIGVRQPDAVTTQKGEEAFKGAYFYVYANVTEANPNLTEYTATVRTSADALAATLSTPTLVNGVYRWVWETNAATAADNYSVSLSIKDRAGATASLAKALYANVTNSNASLTFETNVTSPCSGQTIEFFGIAYNGTARLAGWPVTLGGLVSASLSTNSEGVYSHAAAVSGSGTANVTSRLAYTAYNTSIGVSFASCAAATATPTPTAAPTATSTPAPTQTPTPPPEPTPNPTPAIQTISRDLSETASVTAALGQGSSEFTLAFKANESGFNGTIEYELPFDYADYASGKLTLSPAPKSAKNGSVIASWDVSLAAGEEFKVKATYAAAALPSILDQFKPPALRVKPIAATTPTPPPETGIAGFAKSQGGNILVAVIVVIAVIAGLLSYSKIKSKQASPESAVKDQPPQKQQAGGQPQSPGFRPLNIKFDVGLPKKDEEGKTEKKP